MMLAKTLVTIVGLAFIAFVNWYFLLSRRKPR
jgi:plastocyanin domain-containing protein